MGLSESWGTLFWGPYNTDPTYSLGYYIRVPIFSETPSYSHHDDFVAGKKYTALHLGGFLPLFWVIG